MDAGPLSLYLQGMSEIRSTRNLDAAIKKTRQNKKQPFFLIVFKHATGKLHHTQFDGLFIVCINYYSLCSFVQLKVVAWEQFSGYTFHITGNTKAWLDW